MNDAGRGTKALAKLAGRIAAAGGLDVLRLLVRAVEQPDGLEGARVRMHELLRLLEEAAAARAKESPTHRDAVIVDVRARLAERPAQDRGEIGEAAVIRIGGPAREPTMDEAEWWYRDLATWPDGFQRLRTYLDFKLSPTRIANQAVCGVGDLVDRRLGVNGYSPLWLAEQLEWRTKRIRACAHALRKSRRASERAVLPRKRAKLEWAKQELLTLLFEVGHRRFPRALVAEVARVELAAERAGLFSKLERFERWLAAERSHVERGTYASGRRRGDTYDVRDLKRHRARVARLEEGAQKVRARLAYLESDRSPLRAWGLYTERENDPLRESVRS